jgi:4-hydroxyphenylacetate 3-monooxygenase
MTTAGIRTGAQYLEGLRDDREIWTRGTRVQDVTAEPGMAGGAASLAGFLDRQHEAAYRDIVTYEDAQGIRCAISHMVPKSKDDVVRRGRAFYEWATWSNGMFGRTPDYKNASVMAFAHAPGFLAQGSKGRRFCSKYDPVL